jgi:hypothetical protein
MFEYSIEEEVEPTVDTASTTDVANVLRDRAQSFRHCRDEWNQSRRSIIGPSLPRHLVVMGADDKPSVVRHELGYTRISRRRVGVDASAR